MVEGLTDGEIEDRLRTAPDARWQELWDSVDAMVRSPAKGHWAGGETAEPVVHAPYVVYSDAVLDVIDKVSGLGAGQPFDWQGWDGFNRYHHGRGLDQAPVAESIRMVTAVVRADRFVEGTLLASLETGAFMAAIGRLRRWYDEERVR